MGDTWKIGETLMDQRLETQLTIGLVAHHAFCPRRAWLEAAGERTDTGQVASGVAQHRRADDPRDGRSHTARALDVAHVARDYVGRCDTVETLADGSLRVVEYKATPVRRSSEVTEPMRIQLALQVAALSDMGHTVNSQAVYFTDQRQLVDVALDEADFTRAFELVEATRASLCSPHAPSPLEDDSRCTRCSHVEVCLPDERTLAPIRRRIIVADPDTQVLHLTTPGSRASVRDGRVRIVKGAEELATFPIERIQGVIVHGNVDLSGALIREILWRQLSIVWCTGSGRVVGWASSTDAPNGATRSAQQLASTSDRVAFASEFISAKIANQATLLRRNGTVDASTVHRLRELSRAALGIGSIAELFGVEGEAAAIYFSEFGSMLGSGQSFDARDRRPARDPVKAALNYAYALLLADAIRALRACGLDPHLGFLHSSNRNKPALALDLVEEFRAPLADSTVVRAFNNGELGRGSFVDRMGTFALSTSGRKALIAAYERRALSEIRHPVFGYRATWRRVIEIQARLILGVIDGSQPAYRGVRTR